MEQWKNNSNSNNNILFNSVLFQKFFTLLQQMKASKNQEGIQQKHWRLDIGFFNILF
jgi:hypothetical protein